MKTTKILLFFLTIFVSCCKEPCLHEEAGDSLIARFAKQSKKDQGLFLEGSGGAFYQDIKKFDFDFASNRIVNIDEARKMIVYTIENLLNMINNDENLQQYLHKRPFDQKDLDIMISFPGRPGSDEIALIIAIKKGIFYRTKNGATGKYEKFLDESYDDSLRIVRDQGMQF